LLLQVCACDPGLIDSQAQALFLMEFVTLLAIQRPRRFL
jgi:hypothetical protein